MTRQFCIQAAVGLVLFVAASCVSTPSEKRTTVRFSIPEGSTRVAVLGTADPTARPRAEDPIGRPRRPAALALWSRGPDVLTLVDAPEGTLDALAGLALPEGFRAGAGAPVDRIFLTEGTADRIEGLRPLAEAAPPEARIEVLVPPGTAIPSPGDPLVAEGRLAFRAVGHGEEIELSPTARVTAFHVPLADGRTALGVGVAGVERRLLYLPRLGPLERLAPGLVELAAPAALVLLDGSRYRPGDPDDGAGGPAITTLLTRLDGLPRAGHAVFFTRLAPGNPLLDPRTRESRLLDDAQRALALDGTEWWL
ncbi:MAG: MBL fold metallo-hydrolase [Planctomycetota bacterium JB042]